MGNRSDKYFVDLQGEEYLDALREKVNSYRSQISTNGQAKKWQLSMGSVYGISPDGKLSWAVSPGGEFGELVEFKVNDYASLIKHQLVLAVQNRPAGIAKAINTDIKTLRDARIGSQLVEYYLADPSHNFEDDYIMALFLALTTTEAFIVQEWDVNKGEVIATEAPEEPMDMEVGAAPPEPKQIKAGDLYQQVFPTWNVARDVGAPTANLPWRIFSWRENKFELAAKYSAYKEDVLLSSNYLSGTNSAGIQKPVLFAPTTDNTDYIEVHKLIHMPTEACPNGRYTIFINSTVLLDTEYPYPAKNFHRVSDQEIIETCWAHTSNFDLLSLEQVTDTLHSIVLNNQATFGVSTIVGPKGGGITHQTLAKGLRYIELEPQFVDMIKPLQLTSTPVEVFNYIQMMGSKKGEISGINSILRGDPEGALKGSSGAAMALLQSQAIQFNSNVQRAFYRLLSSAGTGIIEILRKFATEERVVKIAGKQNSQAIKEFKFDGSTLQSVSTVVFEPVNPVLQTASGRMTIADNLLQAGLLTNPKRYIEVLTTGNLNVLLEDTVAMEESVIEENELLSEGQPVQAVITENHQAHIMGHQSVISKPNAKKDPAVVQATLMHIDEHIQLWQQASMTNPALLAATGQQVLPPMPGMVAPGAPPSSEGAPGPGPAAVANPASNEAKQPSLPNPPKNPATGEPAPVQPGTSVA